MAAHRRFVVCVVLVLCSHCLKTECSLDTEADLSDDIVFQSGSHQTLKVGPAIPRRYLLYHVNHGEGFNLRRDVYMRIANLVQRLQQDGDWVLVLPPWGRLYHWRTRSLEQIRIPWATFFDVESLNRYIPVIEFEDFIKETGQAAIDQILYLQAYKEGWTNGKWEEKIDERECIEPPAYRLDEAGVFRGWFWGYPDAYAKAFKCLSVQGMARILAPVLLNNFTARSVFVDRGEKVMHDRFGDVSYWTVRRSMRFAKHLRDIGDEFRESKLESTDEKDKTVMTDNWRDMERKPGSAIGGPYLAAHLRREDFARNNRKEVPTLERAADQIKVALKKYKLEKVFVATDAPKHEIEELRRHLQDYQVYNYVPPKGVLENFKDGGVAIIDQWICAHARYFIGTGVSTFSFRIHEERQILGFDTKMTYNRFCGHSEPEDCEQPSVWKIVYH
ncbi:GDP-fucose protein O-fucosyltransferase 2-like isoform X1 [Patiria miniata]|uniref:GDP-fucose protein O-fucosyltransferase 2 n=1 Tax=Patiria miniata TaxID=46514 RepID=A0A914BQB7_PATMI|nr:GDP-fucose protein O-fucosyltransferase 2-like isoform X1 [Patiria miniata]